MSWKGDSHSFREWENAWLCLALKEGGDRALSNSAYTDVPIDTAPPYKSYFLTSCFLFIALILYTWNIQESEQSRSLPGLKSSHGTNPHWGSCLLFGRLWGCANPGNLHRLDSGNKASPEPWQELWGNSQQEHKNEALWTPRTDDPRDRRWLHGLILVKKSM